MPPRLQTITAKATSPVFQCCHPLRIHRLYATTTVDVSAPFHERSAAIASTNVHYPSTQPPSYKPPEFRKSQLLRQYASLLRSTPLMLLFQHNNLKSTEWVALRRELAKALAKVDEAIAASGAISEPLQNGIKIQIIQTGIFGAALKVVEFYEPATNNEEFTHALSKSAHSAASKTRKSHDLAPLLSGPLALVTFPQVSPQHLKAVFSILAPNAPQFPPPTRRANPGWHDISVQGGLQKLLLLGARVEGAVFDVEGAKWIGTIDGGIDGLRAQLVAMLQGIGAGVTNTLENAGRSLYFTVDGRRKMLEDDKSTSEA